MSHRPSRAHVRRLALGLSLALLAASLAVPAIAESLSNKSFTAVFSAAEPNYQVVLTNTSQGGDGLTLGSARITTTTESGTSSTETFRRLDNAPGGSETLTLDAAFECGVTNFDVQAKQSNNFNGTGNDLDLDVSGSVLFVDVPCAPAEPPLFLSFATQPSDTKVNAAITPAPAVQIVTDDGKAYAKDGVAITMTLVDGSLAGTPLRVTTNPDGLATFSNLEVATTGLGFELEADATDYDPVPSDSFDVFDELCSIGTCSSTAGGLRDNGNLLASASGTAPAAGAGLSVSVDDLPTIDVCSVPEGVELSRLPNQVTVVALGLTNKTVEIRVDKSFDQQQTNNGVSFYQICAEPIAPESDFSSFYDRYSGALVTIGGEGDGAQAAGWLPNCSDSDDAPCVVSRVKRGGDPVITVRWGSGFRFR